MLKFQVGQRVRLRNYDPSEDGAEGVVTGVHPAEEYPYRVRWEVPYTAIPWLHYEPELEAIG